MSEADEPAAPPASLLERLRADPVRAPEHVALAAADAFGPPAATWAHRQRNVMGLHPIAMGEMARKRHANLASAEGAAAGIGGIVTIVPDLVALAWLQSRMVFFIAGAYGWDPRDPMRPAELLALTGLYSDPAGARRALDGAAEVSVAEHWVGSKLQRDEALASKLLKMVGKSGAKKVAGKLIPGFAIAFSAVSNRRDTNRLGKRAVDFYGQSVRPELPPR
ncbi:EcsC family protein [Solirubrobacter sp. CPCC 204708]|uniref:EcsC family protein n=1 Tax=Solirubrobacter deserti TaxID=2282478 RepID=A0ABT4RUS9_9ACTN|nr:EcsC family protein [Solirubrobacter deserti]MBE2317259.1 EcsC family protein [Solirubrobacter deserti]MDA0142026.1 EcsC family protein [Solirubrobacter deserti]